jgi:hypothetical protein
MTATLAPATERFVTVIYLYDNPLLVGENLPTGRLSLPAERPIQVGDKRIWFRFVDNELHAEWFTIEGSMKLDLTNEADRNNLGVLEKLIETHSPEVCDQEGRPLVKIVRPGEDSRRKLVEMTKRTALIQIILAHADDRDWLEKVYRRVIGLTNGIASEILTERLVSRADMELTKFIIAGDKWVFEDEFFAVRALLDHSLEAGLLMREGKDILVPGGQIYADSEEKAIYKLNDDYSFRSYLQEQINLRVSQAKSSVLTLTPEQSELVNLPVVATGTLVETDMNPDGSVRKEGREQRMADHIEQVVSSMIDSGLLAKEPGGKLRDVNIDKLYDNRSEVAFFLKENKEVLAEMERMLEIASPIR